MASKVSGCRDGEDNEADGVEKVLHIGDDAGGLVKGLWCMRQSVRRSALRTWLGRVRSEIGDGSQRKAMCNGLRAEWTTRAMGCVDAGPSRQRQMHRCG